MKIQTPPQGVGVPRISWRNTPRPNVPSPPAHKMGVYHFSTSIAKERTPSPHPPPPPAPKSPSAQVPESKDQDLVRKIWVLLEFGTCVGGEPPPPDLSNVHLIYWSVTQGKEHPSSKDTSPGKDSGPQMMHNSLTTKCLPALYPHSLYQFLLHFNLSQGLVESAI